MARSSAQLHQPGLAELVAGVLRRRIIDGEISDGEFLPSQDALLAEFHISRPPLREALRILETEGLITVLRGNVGGSVVHRPDAAHAAYTLSLVLESRQATLDDVAVALKEMEGLCAGLAAARPDRVENVVPALRERNARTREVLEDQLAYVEMCSDFHRELVAGCGNTTLQLVVGSLEQLWLAHVRSWAEMTTAAGRFPDLAYRTKGLVVHEQIVELIEGGEIAKATKLAREHFDPSQYADAENSGQRRVDAATLRLPGQFGDRGNGGHGDRRV